MMDPEEKRSVTPDPSQTRGQQAQYRFTTEELRVLRECNKESFYKRCIPLSAILAGSTFLAVKNNILSPNPRFGATPKVIVAVVLGYFIGKVTYQSKCAEKLMQLPNSQIGEMLRKKRRGSITESMDPTFGAGMSLAPFTNMNPSEMYSDDNPNNSLDIDTSRPDEPGLEDYRRPSMDNPIYEEEMPPEQKNATTYEELRKKNREEFLQKRLGNYREPARTAPVQSNADTGSSKNKYGDVFE